MTLEFVPVKLPIDQQILAGLAAEVWMDYWPDLIGAEQTIYMIEKFQSLPAITHDMQSNNYEYWFLQTGNATTSGWKTADGKPIAGFTGGHIDTDTNRFFISKIYLHNTQRGKHYASRVIDFYTILCKKRNLDAMYLTVNKHNNLGIRAYKGNGFVTVDSTKTNIGHGFVMDDYVMEKRI